MVLAVRTDVSNKVVDVYANQSILEVVSTPELDKEYDIAP